MAVARTAGGHSLLVLLDVLVGSDASHLLERAEEGGAGAEAATLGQGIEGVLLIPAVLHQLLELADAILIEVVVVATLQVLVEEIREEVSLEGAT